MNKETANADLLLNGGHAAVTMENECGSMWSRRRMILDFSAEKVIT